MRDIAFVSIVFIVFLGVPLWSLAATARAILVELRANNRLLKAGLWNNEFDLPLLVMVVSRLNKIAYGQEL